MIRDIKINRYLQFNEIYSSVCARSSFLSVFSRIDSDISTASRFGSYMRIRIKYIDIQNSLMYWPYDYYDSLHDFNVRGSHCE